MADADEATTQEAEKPPPLTVPGVLDMLPVGITSAERERLGIGESEPLHEITVGPLHGYCTPEWLTNWKHSYKFVALADLSLDARLEWFPKLANEWRALALSDKPSANGPYREGQGQRPEELISALANATLLLVGSTYGRDPGKASKINLRGDHRIVEIGFARNADDYFHLSISRAGKTAVTIAGPYYSLRPLFDFGQPNKPYVDGDYDEDSRDRLLSRLANAASGGLVNARSIALAFALNDMATPADWSKHHHVPSIAERDLGERIARVLDSAATGRGSVVALPVYGNADLVTLPSFKLRALEPDEADLMQTRVQLENATEIVVPADDIWVVRNIGPTRWAVDQAPLPPWTPPIRKRSSPRGGLLLLWGIALIFVVYIILRERRKLTVEPPCKHLVAGQCSD